MGDENPNGVVYVYDLNGNSFEKSKFMIQCHQGQNIKLKPNVNAHAVLVWSYSNADSSGKSYYGQHSLQYVQIYGGRDRQFIPVFNDMVQAVEWTPNGERFIVISGTQPATATLYDKDASPLFEFGKRFRNTIKINPFSQVAMIGGFGGLNGQMDFWDLDTMKELGNSRSELAVGIEWSPDGLSLMTSVLYETVKVDNDIRFFDITGRQLLEKPKGFERVDFVQVQPGSYSKPNIEGIKKAAAKKAENQPKKTFVMPGGNNDAFA